MMKCKDTDKAGDKPAPKARPAPKTKVTPKAKVTPVPTATNTAAATKRKTRKQNVDAQLEPEDAVGPKRKRRTAAEVAADKKAKDEAARAQENKMKESLRHVAALEEEIAQEDANDMMPRPIRPLMRTDTFLQLPLEAEEDDGTINMEDDVSAPTSDYQAPDTSGDTDPEMTPLAKKKARKDKTSSKSVEDEGDGINDGVIKQAPPKKSKPIKADVRTAINAERKANNPEEGRSKKNPALQGTLRLVCCFYPTVILINIHMLTLDETMLFYFSPYTTRHHSDVKSLIGNVSQWTAAVIPSVPNTQPSSRSSSSTKALSTTKVPLSRTTTKSLLSDTVIIRSVPKPATKIKEEIQVGGLSDTDESHGAEHDEAASSPVKGYGVRKDSKVSRNSNSSVATLSYGCTDYGKHRGLP